MESHRPVGCTTTNVMTPYGLVSVAPRAPGWAVIVALESETQHWATRPGARWPCSTLSGCSVKATFAAGDLVDLEVRDRDGCEVRDLDAHEFNAWSTDCLTAAGFPDHEAVR